MRPLRPVLALSAGALTAVALVGACGTSGGSTGSGTSGAIASASAASSTRTTASAGPENPTLPGDGRGRLVTVTGTVTAGVENGCLLLTTDPASPDGPWQLIGNVAGIRAGQKVTVRGARVDTVATICQQGLPFDVQTVVNG